MNFTHRIMPFKARLNFEASPDMHHLEENHPLRIASFRDPKKHQNPTYRRSKYIRFSYTFVYTLIVA